MFWICHVYWNISFHYSTLGILPSANCHQSAKTCTCCKQWYQWPLEFVIFLLCSVFHWARLSSLDGSSIFFLRVPLKAVAMVGSHSSWSSCSGTIPLRSAHFFHTRDPGGRVLAELQCPLLLNCLFLLIGLECYPALVAEPFTVPKTVLLVF